MSQDVIFLTLKIFFRSICYCYCKHCQIKFFVFRSENTTKQRQFTVYPLSFLNMLNLWGNHIKHQFKTMYILTSTSLDKLKSYYNLLWITKQRLLHRFKSIWIISVIMKLFISAPTIQIGAKEHKMTTLQLLGKSVCRKKCWLTKFVPKKCLYI